MLRQIFALTVKDLKVLLRDRGGMVVLFLMPAMFILVMSTALASSFDVGTADKPIELLVVNRDEGDLAGQAIAELDAIEGLDIIQSLDGVRLTREAADTLVADGDYSVALIFPADFSERVLAAATDPDSAETTVTFIADPSTGSQFLAPIQGSVQGFIQKTAAYAQAPLQIEAGFKNMAANTSPAQAPIVSQIGAAFVDQLENGDSLGSTGSLGVTFEQVAPASFVVEEFPTAVEQSVPGYTIFGVFFIVQVIATSILREKQEGTFRRLMVAPMSRAALLVGKLLPFYLVNLIQVALMFGIGVVVFGMNLGESTPALVIVTLSVAAAATGMGLLVAALGKTPEQIGGISTLLALTLAAVGGMMVPTFVMPEFMQTISKISPHNWALSAYQDIIVRGLSTNAVMPEVAVLLGFAVIFFGFALWRFRFE